MTAFVLVSGSLLAPPQQRTGRTGKPFVTATLWGDDAYWSLICFGEAAQAELMRLAAGDQVTAQGRLELSFYQKQGKDQLRRGVTVEHVLALRDPARAQAEREAGSP